MGRTGLTQDEVFEVCDALLRFGERPTQQNVRARLGTGSMSTIQRGIDAWWSALAARLDGPPTARGQPDVPDFVQEAAQQLWRGALEAAAEAAKADVAQLRSDLAAQRDALEAERAGVLAELAAALEAQALADQARATAEARSTGLETALASSGEHLAEALARLESAAGAQRQLEDALLAARAQTDAVRAEAARREVDNQAHVRGLEDRAHTEIDRARQAQKTAEDALRRIQAQAADADRRAQQELEQARRQQAAAAQSSAVVQAERDRLSAEVATLKALLEQALRTNSPRASTPKLPARKRAAASGARRRKAPDPNG